MEIWKQLKIKDYYISNYGRLKKYNYLSKKNSNNRIKYINLLNNGYGYLEASLYNKLEKKSKYYYIHRLVAEAFIPNPNNYPCVNHKDGNKLNNRVDNLEWCTYQQNMKHAVENNLYKRLYGKDNKHSKIYVELDINYNFIREIIGTRQEGREQGFSREKVSRVARHEVYKTKENKIYFYANEFYSKDIDLLKKEHEEKVHNWYKNKYKNSKRKDK